MHDIYICKQTLNALTQLVDDSLGTVDCRCIVAAGYGCAYTKLCSVLDFKQLFSARTQTFGRYTPSVKARSAERVALYKQSLHTTGGSPGGSLIAAGTGTNDYYIILIAHCSSLGK